MPAPPPGAPPAPPPPDASPTLPPEGDTWDLPGLVAVARSLAAPLSGADERVNWLPDERTVRYYQTTGLVDRPLRHEGRTALYGQRHLLQVLAVKALQAEGHSLAQIQGMLAGISTAELLFAVQRALFGPGPPGPGGGPAPAEVARQPAASPAPLPPASPSPADPSPATLHARRIHPGITVLVDPQHFPDPDLVFTLFQSALLAALHNLPDGAPR